MLYRMLCDRRSGCNLNDSFVLMHSFSYFIVSVVTTTLATYKSFTFKDTAHNLSLTTIKRI